MMDAIQLKLCGIWYLKPGNKIPLVTWPCQSMDLKNKFLQKEQRNDCLSPSRPKPLSTPMPKGGRHNEKRQPMSCISGRDNVYSMRGWRKWTVLYRVVRLMNWTAVGFIRYGRSRINRVEIAWFAKPILCIYRVLMLWTTCTNHID